MFRRPIDLAEVLKAGGVFLLVVAVTVAVAVLSFGKADDRRQITGLRSELRDARVTLAEANEVTACRSRLANDVSDATSSYLLTIGGLVENLRSEDRAKIAAALSAMSAAGRSLDAARNVRNDFESHPSTCPDPPPD